VLAAAVTNVAAPVVVEKGIRLKMKWVPGRRYVYRLELEQHSTNRVADLPKARNEDLAFGLTYALTVEPAKESGPSQLQVELIAFDLSVKIGGLSAMAFDSAASNASPDPITGPFTKLIGTKLRLELDSEGKVERVLGGNEWVAQVVGDAQGPAEDMIRQQFNDGFFRQLADFGRGFPPGPVEVGDNWPYRVDVPAGALGTIQASAVVAFVRSEEHDPHKLAVLQTRGTLKGVPLPSHNNPGDLKFDQGTTTGETWFDPVDGVVFESVVEQTMRLTGELSGSDGSSPGPAAFTSNLAQKVTVKLVE
jgi:hypothetical protein